MMTKSKIIDLFFQDINDVLSFKDSGWTIDKFLRKYTPELNYSDTLKKLLYEQTDNCITIFENFIEKIITDYLQDKVSIEEIMQLTNTKFKELNNTNKKMFNLIFPHFINLLIEHKILMDDDKNVIVVYPRPKKNKYDDIDIPEEISEPELSDDKSSDDESIEENEIQPPQNINDIELLKYDENKKQFNFRNNQKDAINKTIEQNFESGIHCQIMGAGKTFIMLNIIYQHWLKYKQNLVYIISTDRIDILKSWFMTDLIDKIQSLYVKKKSISKITDEVFKSQDYMDYEKDYIKKTQYYKEPDGKRLLTFNYDRFKKWTDDEIIDMNQFDITENIINKDKERMDVFNETLKKPLLLITNNSFLKAGEKYKKINCSKIGLLLIDECHSISGAENYKMLEYFRNSGVKIQGFSATPLRPVKNAEDYLLKVYGTTPHNDKTNKINIISNYDMIKGIKDQNILPIVHTIINPQTDSNTIKINSLDKHDLTLKKIIETYFINNKELPYKKGVIWVNSIAKIAKNIGTYYKEINNLCKTYNIELFVSYSGNKTYTPINELSNFEKSTKNALLLCVNRVKEGSDIKNLDCGIFLDAVKNRSIVSSLQSIGRIMRPDEEKKKKYAFIIESVKLDENKTIESLSVSTVLNYYKKILNISTLSSNTDYIEKIQELFDETKIVNDNNKKSIHIIIDKEKDIRCKINLNIKSIDWRIFQNSLRTELASKLNIDEDTILEREFINLKYETKKMGFSNKNEYKNYARKNKFEEFPETKYEKWWINYYKFLGIDTSKYPKTKEELIRKCKTLNINAENYYENIDKYQLPVMPEDLYHNFGILNNELNNNQRTRRK
jgi:superfamily II DNA or RNA helicase